MPRISLIVAMSRNRVIGRDNRLPWHLPDDLRRFKQITLGHHIVMGRKTWESINRLLPGRTTVIVSRDPKFAVEGAVVVGSIEHAVQLARDDSEVFIIGGAEIFRLALTIAERLYLTTIDADVEGDTLMPPIDFGAWRRIEAESHPVSDTNPLPWTFAIYERVTANGADGC